MKKIKIFFLFFLISVFSLSTSLAEEKELPSLKLSELIDEALKNNPGIKALKNRFEALSQKPSQEGTLDDPKLMLGITNVPVDEFGFDSESMTQKEIGISQMFPFPGKLKLRSEIAQKEADAAEKEYHHKVNEISEKVKDVYYELFYIYKTIGITEKNKNLITEFVKIAETKYSVGQGIQQDILKAQVELSKIINEQIGLEQERESAEAMLNSILSRNPQSPVGKPDEFEKTKLKFSIEELMKMAESNMPILLGIKDSVQQFEKSYSLAKKDYYPDFEFNLSYGQRDRLRAEGMSEDWPDMISATVTINLPIWRSSKLDKKVEETLANKRMAEEQYNSMKNEIYFNLKDIIAEVKKGERLLELYKTGIIPQAAQSLESAMAGYEVNKIDFLTLLDNQITLFNYEIEYYKVLSDYEKKLAKLETMVGMKLF
ncbi:MAG: hypothetical protein A3C43_00625 [Candidatus Schekmanbacteria bacterium RIFCSPHIGHO2_02_FULL_38_11]|uniref:Transporter n=1 Tax=Candidatus Schekmanbacteria bacterium RIFCSPLOWO2_12_FULL_38_15 TaxID=1817883 RepID=A0A1F7SNF3_9BACT|nr:MAG: hypothetical protein A2043_02715 [Candidatus Schekmanbacteria bacterium GWA2_38_9]OGL48419.1 MAG: hypothetical protein A3H37_05460 [Candidatus Schekmanbacteria bacterium RIFCSPLOWO2_02_FULL_38_14]OGL52012.1 MAG: hypothetical protein A3C43_00625 [Candidatus Schekmanbacteria bacterium RIFCSPHIGHO2_02_FULL_38_11]OGL55301.1 MAG: hypothetical protein A3G31_04660 [Candidatus Schekmanbacteria bacterium RIFCSPLOWO2_12_FULL_38_15]